MSISNRIPVHGRASMRLVASKPRLASQSWLFRLKSQFADVVFGILFTDAHMTALASLDTRHFGESDIAEVFGVSHSLARRLCRMAVRRGVLHVKCEQGPLGPKNVYRLSESPERIMNSSTDPSPWR